MAILSQPDWHSCEPWRVFGRPRLALPSAPGNMDSMLNHYTANRKVRNDDAYSPGGQIGRRPDRATLAYCQRAREAYKGVPVIAGGVEASPAAARPLRLLERQSPPRRSCSTPRPTCWSIGMGERPCWKSWRRLAAGADATADSRYPRRSSTARGPAKPRRTENTIALAQLSRRYRPTSGRLPQMTRIAHLETNPYNARRLVQYHGREAVVVNPPALPLSEAEMDRVYGLPYTRRPHPSYGGRKFRRSRWSRTRSRSCAAASAAARSARSRPTKAG